MIARAASAPRSSVARAASAPRSSVARAASAPRSSIHARLLTRALLRALWREPGRVLAAVGLCAAAICVYAGTLCGLARVEDTTQALYQSLRLHDLELRGDPQALEGLPSIEELSRVPGVSAAAWRLSLPGQVELSGGRPAGAAVLAWSVGAPEALRPDAPRPAVDDLLLLRGRPLRAGAPDQVLIDKTFAEDHGLQLGDALQLRVAGRAQTVHVGGVAVLPEHLMSSIDQSFPVPIRGTLAAVVVSQELVAATTGEALGNSLVVRLQAGARREAVRDALVALLARGGAPVRAALFVEDQFSVLCNRNRIHSYRDGLPTFIGVFCGLSFLVVLLVFRRVAHRWHKEIATLRAYGVSAAAVCSGFACAALLIFALAAVLGAAGAYALQAQISREYLRGTGFPLLLAGPPLAPLLWALLLCLGTLLPAALMPCWRLLRTPPAQLLRQQAALESATALLWIGRVDAPLARRLGMAAPERLGLRNVLRRPATFLSALACVTGMVVGASSMYFFSDGLVRVIQGFLAGQRWDHLVQFAAPTAVTAELAARLRGLGAAEVEPIYGVEAQLAAGGQARSYLLVAAALPWRLRQPTALIEGAPLAAEEPPDIMINLRLAQALRLGVGDTLRARVGARDEPLRVAAIVGNDFINQAFVSVRTLERLQGRAALPVAVLVRGQRAQVGGDGARLWLGLSRLPEAARVVPRAAVEEASLAGCALLVGAIRLYGHLSTALGAVLVLVLVLTSVTDRAGEYALLRSLGFSGVALLRSLLVEVALLSGLALLLALPLTRLMTLYFQRRIMQISDFVPVTVPLDGYLRLVLPAFLYMMLATLPALRRALQVPLALVLRQRALG